MRTVGAWRSLVAHLFWVQGVVSSNLAAPTISSSQFYQAPDVPRESRSANSARGQGDQRWNQSLVDCRAAAASYGRRIRVISLGLARCSMDFMQVQRHCCILYLVGAQILIVTGLSHKFLSPARPILIHISSCIFSNRISKPMEIKAKIRSR